MSRFRIYIGIIILFVILLTCFWLVNKFNNLSKLFCTSYNNISGYINDKNAQDVITIGKKIKNPTNLEQYRIGNVTLNNIQDITTAGKEYMITITSIVNNPLEHENLFILDKIQEDFDRFGHYLTPYNIRRIVPQTRNHVTNNIINSTNSQYYNKSKQTQKVETYKEKENWTADIQNVHDTQINKKLREHFNKIKRYNTEEYGNLTHKQVNTTMTNMEHYINNKNLPNASKVLNQSKCGLSVVNVGTEHEVLIELWRRINSKSNINNVDQLKKSFAESLNDCMENGNLVCTQGRVTRMIQCLSHMDSDKELGLMQTTEAIRNSVYKNAGNILNNNIENLSKEDKDIYNNSGSNASIKKVENQTREEITQMVNNTEGLDSNQRPNLIKECLAVV